ncbi:CDP-alcohol phosphatidyltransferase family protein [Enterocloster clostridioformis]|uniref:CDP-alcohol phosphatidyltransferase family protein n=1 Tax=Enterocloster clostridioformis TaxID=1531 RepID=UPI000AFBA4CA|nr:CDP-alcohol phosphatidyltransferase family protein [Enterocloster clostridioformis]QQR02403.1 CDP-alcohol phosphatidyltransferase family protein [Enterocloster clostridioformis]
MGLYSMIGFYSYTVVLTYLGLASSAIGMILTFQGFAKYALFCLAFSGLCDMFDGKVARMKKDRTEDEKRFGIQIDSLCDVVCFGAFPMILCYSIGMRGPAGISILVFYLIAGVIRLAFFNVMEEKRQEETDEARKYYQGLPITSIAIILPLFCTLRPLLGHRFLTELHICILTVGLLFIINFPLRKPGWKMLTLLVAIVSCALIKIYFF